jgi:hypothetical protein
MQIVDASSLSHVMQSDLKPEELSAISLQSSAFAD